MSGGFRYKERPRKGGLSLYLGPLCSTCRVAFGEDSYRELVGFGTTDQVSSVQCERSNGEFLPLVIEALR